MPAALGEGAVKPDLVIGPGDSAPDKEPWEALNPCPFCDSYQHDAPEGIHDVHSVRKHVGATVGDPRWNFPHCYKCGYRPGTNNAVSAKEMARQYDAFKEWVNSQQDKVFAGQPSIHPELAEQNADMKRQLDEMKAELDAIRLGKGNSDAGS